MIDTFGVSRFQRISDLNRKTEEHADFKRAQTHTVLERRSFEELHRDEGLAIVRADLVDRADSGVIQGRCRAGFPAKTFEGLRVIVEVFGQELECNKAAELSVLSFVNHTHAAAAELLKNAVMRNGPTEQMARAPASMEHRRGHREAKSTEVGSGGRSMWIAWRQWLGSPEDRV